VAVVGIGVYVAIDVALGFLRPDLSLLHTAESDYGVGAYSWLMDLNFVLRGVLSIAAAGAVWRSMDTSSRPRVGLILIGLWGLASALLALFPDQPVLAHRYSPGAVHLLLALVAFISVAVGELLVSLNLGDLAGGVLARALLSISLLAILAVLLLGRAGFRSGGEGGLFERTFLGLILAWLLVLSLHIWRTATIQRVAASG
jgi:hypothetical membrane protein